MASVVPKCSPCVNKDMRMREDGVMNSKPYRQHSLSTFFFFFYLVEEIDNLGENVEASSWINGSLIEDASL